MSLDFSSLKDLPAAPTSKEWQPPVATDLGEGMVLALDQSLTATGLIWVVSSGTGCEVLVADQWKGREGDKSIATSLLRGTDIYVRAVEVFTKAKEMGFEVVHESPPNPAAVKGMGISSLLAAQSLHNAAKQVGIEITSIGAQPAKKFCCGNTKADKAEAHAALKTHILPWVAGADLITNEAKRDALMVGLLHLARKKR